MLESVQHSLDALLQPIGLLWAALLLATAVQLFRRRILGALYSGALVVFIQLIGGTELPAWLMADLERPYDPLVIGWPTKADAVVMLGGQLRSGYRFVAELVGLTEAMADADRVGTGEGRLDAGSFAGKVVGGVVADARNLGLATLVVAGQTTSDATAEAVGAGCTVLSLTERFGAERALGDTLACVREAATGWLAGPIG